MRLPRESGSFQDRQNRALFLTILLYSPKIRFVSDYTGGEDDAE